MILPVSGCSHLPPASTYIARDECLCRMPANDAQLTKHRMCLATLALLLVMLLSTMPNLRADDLENSRYGVSEVFFGQKTVPHLKLTVSAKDIDQLRIEPRKYVSATLREGSQEYAEVAIKLKGGSGGFRPIDGKPSFTLNMDKFLEGQKYHGLDKFHLNNSVQDPTYMCESIGHQVFSSVGIPTPRVTHAVVTLNNRILGLYVLKEGFDKTFLRRHFENPNGNLYDGGFFKDIDTPLEKDSGDGPDDHSDLKALLHACQQAGALPRVEALAPHLDVPEFLKFAAVETMIGHWDGYTMNANNYRLYHDPSRGQFVFLPHGMDQLFFKDNKTIVPSPAGLVGKALLEDANGKDLYL